MAKSGRYVVRPGVRVGVSMDGGVVLIVVVPVALVVGALWDELMMWRVVVGLLALVLFLNSCVYARLARAWNRRVDIDLAEQAKGPASLAWCTRARDSHQFPGTAVPTRDGGVVFFPYDGLQRQYRPAEILTIDRSPSNGWISMVTSDTRTPDLLICPEPWGVAAWEQLRVGDTRANG